MMQSPHTVAVPTSLQCTSSTRIRHASILLYLTLAEPPHIISINLPLTAWTSYNNFTMVPNLTMDVTQITYFEKTHHYAITSYFCTRRTYWCSNLIPVFALGSRTVPFLHFSQQCWSLKIVCSKSCRKKIDFLPYGEPPPNFISQSSPQNMVKEGEGGKPKQSPPMTHFVGVHISYPLYLGKSEETYLAVPSFPNLVIIPSFTPPCPLHHPLSITPLCTQRRNTTVLPATLLLHFSHIFFPFPNSAYVGSHGCMILL